jgi:hypothetical protein
MSGSEFDETIFDLGGVLSEPVKPCGCLSFGEDCPQCRIHPTCPEDACPVEAVFAGDTLPCLLIRGHGGSHRYISEDPS